MGGFFINSYASYIFSLEKLSRRPYRVGEEGVFALTDLKMI